MWLQPLFKQPFHANAAIHNDSNIQSKKLNTIVLIVNGITFLLVSLCKRHLSIIL